MQDKNEELFRLEVQAGMIASGLPVVGHEDGASGRVAEAQTAVHLRMVAFADAIGFRMPVLAGSAAFGFLRGEGHSFHVKWQFKISCGVVPMTR